MDTLTDLRQRRRDSSETAVKPTDNILKRVTRLDVYPKIGEDFRVQTVGGGYVSLISGIIMIILFFSELSRYLYKQRSDRITIDKSMDEKLLINFNFTFYEISCDKASLDVMDISGQQQMGVSSRLVKIDLNGDHESINIPFTSILDEESNHGANCASCMGASLDEEECCNTCESLQSAYKKRGWDTWFVDQYAPVCSKPQASEKQKTKGQGCMMWGLLSVNKVAGNFHVAVGHAENRDSRHVHSFGAGQVFSFNSSHYIQDLHFGDHIPGVKYPLNGKIAYADNLLSHNYYIRVLPTEYHSANGQTLSSNQFTYYSVDRRVEVSAFGQISALPGVFFIYDFSPFLHIVSESNMTLTYFLIRICAVIGGVFAISQLLDSILYYKGKI